MWRRLALLSIVAVFPALVGAQAPSAEQATQRLLDDLDHKNPDRRIEAAKLLGELKAESAVPQLIVALDDPIWGVRSAAAGALWSIGSPAADPAKAALQTRLATDDSGKVKVMAAGALWRLGVSTKELIPQVKTALDSDNPYAEVDAAILLLQMGVEPQEVLPTLERAMSSDQAALREKVATRLLERNPLPAEFEPLMLTALGDSEWSTRFTAVLVLGRVEGGPGSAAVAALQQATRDSSKQVREAASETLATVSPGSVPAPSTAASPSIESLLADMKSRKWDVRVEAIEALPPGESSPEVVAALTKALDDKKSIVRLVAVRALGRAGEPARPTIPKLEAMFEDPNEDPDVRIEAADALTALGETVDRSLLE